MSNTNTTTARARARAAGAAKVAEKAKGAKPAAPAAKPAAAPSEPAKGIAPVRRADDTMRRHYGQGAHRSAKGGQHLPALPQAAHYVRPMVSCPYKAGTKAAATWALFTAPDGSWRTVAEVKALAAKSPASYDVGYIRYAGRDGYIRFEVKPGKTS